MTAILRRALPWLSAVAALVVVAVGYVLVRRGIVLSDEGYLLTQAYEISRGKVLYRDLDSFVAPGVWFLLAALFRLFEPSVLLSRIPALACYCASAYVSYRIIRATASHLAALFGLVLYVVISIWAFPAWTFSFYSPYSMLFALIALDRLLAWRKSQRVRKLLWIGVALGLSAAFKQNFGTLAVMGSGLALASVERERHGKPSVAFRATIGAVAWVTAGMAVTAIPFLVYFAYSGALPAAYDALVLKPFRGFAGQHTVPYPSPTSLLHGDGLIGIRRLTYGAFALTNSTAVAHWPEWLTRFVADLHVVLYWGPPLFFAASTLVAVLPFRRKHVVDVELLIVLIVCALLFLGVFPRADFNHLMNVYQPVVVLTAVFADRVVKLAIESGRRTTVAVLAVITLGIAPFILVGTDWLYELVRSSNTRLLATRGGILLDAYYAAMTDFEVNEIRDRTDPGEAVLTLPGLSMLNFLADRPLPGRYSNFYAVHIGEDGGKEATEAAERENVRMVVAEKADFFEDALKLRDYAPVLTDWLRRNFKIAFTVDVDRHWFLERRPEPLPKRERISLTSHCRVRRNVFGRRVVRSHLLFDSLYHRFGTGHIKGPQEIMTSCTVVVPKHASLRLAIGYRQPLKVGSGTTLKNEVWVLPPVYNEKTMRPRIEDWVRVDPPFDWASPPPREYSVDLSGLAGDEVMIGFRTVFSGEVDTNPLDAEGFAATIHDPRIEFESAAPGTDR